MARFNSIWDVTPQTAHWRAVELLRGSIVWNFGDEDSPLGNDTGADTFAALLRYRDFQPNGKTRDFINQQMNSRGIDDKWSRATEQQLVKLLRNRIEMIVLMRWDDFIIALAFAELLLDGELEAEIRECAILAIRQQASDIILGARSSIGMENRKKQLEHFLKVLETAPVR